MLRHIIFFALLVSANAFAMDTYRFGSRLVEVGDSASKLIELAGQPDCKEPIEAKEGGHEGERWQYSSGNSAVTFVSKDSKIASIEQVHN